MSAIVSLAAGPATLSHQWLQVQHKKIPNNMSQNELKFLFFTSIKFLCNLVPLRAGVDSAPPVIPVYFYWDPPTDLSLSSLSVSCKQESVENMTRLAFHMDKPRNLEFGLYTLDTFFYSGGVFGASIWSTYVPLKLSPSRRKRLMGGGQQDFSDSQEFKFPFPLALLGFGSLTLHWNLDSGLSKMGSNRVLI